MNTKSLELLSCHRPAFPLSEKTHNHEHVLQQFNRRQTARPTQAWNLTKSQGDCQSTKNTSGICFLPLSLLSYERRTYTNILLSVITHISPFHLTPFLYLLCYLCPFPIDVPFPISIDMISINIPSNLQAHAHTVHLADLQWLLAKLAFSIYHCLGSRTL